MKKTKIPIGIVFMMAMIPKRHIIAVLDFPVEIGNFIIYAKGIRDSMTPNPIFAPFAAHIALLAGHITTLDAKETNVNTTPPTATTADRDGAIDDVKKDLRTLRSDVQGLADNAVDNDVAQANIIAAGMKVKQMGAVNKQDFKAEDGELSGTVKLIAKGREDHHFNNWHMSQDGTNWVPITPTTAGHALVPGLVRGSTWDFRHQYILPGGPTEWIYVYDWLVR